MARCHVGRGGGKTAQHGRGEHLVHQAEVAVALDDTVIVDRNAAALLPAVLQRVQCAVDGADHIGRAGFIVDTKDAALLVQALGIMGKFAHLLLHLSECKIP